MSLESGIAELTRASTELTATVRGKSAEIDAKVVAKINELDTWRNGAKVDMALPFSTTIMVGGDANTYYPVPVRPCAVHHLGRLVVYRDNNAAHPPALGSNNVAGLVLDMRVRGDAWSDFYHTRVDYYGFAYHQSVARVQTDNIGRFLWLRGGGMSYQLFADFALEPGAVFQGTENLKPIYSENTPVYPLVEVPPYVGGGVKVSPLTAPDPIWGKAITTPTVI
ncbi:hypothetical protein B0T40_12505 [Chromobacterium haemolyticum]|uniref:hypothetical protein n=1 Tax=Chromobacterium haemolyticum TaxID=394935 RepID=UPI0009D9B934|nr:hypothetical protein [Chromobacterium haemolyticum]OQS35558.1 hypothetical protein B0T40_12505 [Chromobacterium haemolyticum]